jgi:REP element-mobilizing transposase RayT
VILATDLPRDDGPDAIHHATARVNNRHRHLAPVERARLFLRVLARQAIKYGVDILAYVLMSNHYHCVVRSPGPAQFRQLTGRMMKGRHFRPWPHGHPNRAVISQCLGRTMWEVARYIQEEMGVTGHFWEDEFHSRRLWTGTDLLVAMAYDHLNPVRQGMARNAEDFPRSSAAFWADAGPGEIVLAKRGLPFGLDEATFREDLLKSQRSVEFRELMREIGSHGLNYSAPDEREQFISKLREAGLVR